MERGARSMATLSPATGDGDNGASGRGDGLAFRLPARGFGGAAPGHHRQAAGVVPPREPRGGQSPLRAHHALRVGPGPSGPLPRSAWESGALVSGLRSDGTSVLRSRAARAADAGMAAVWLDVPQHVLARRGDRRLLSLAFGVGMHILCDPVMRAPEVFFWPLYGWTFAVRLGYAFEVPIDLLRWDPAFAAFAAVVLLRLWHRDRLRGLLLRGRL